MGKRIVHFIQKYIKCKNASTAAEFGFVVMPFILVIFGMMEAGRIGLTMNGVQFAVEETSRYAALNTDATDDELQTYAEAKLSTMFVSTAGFDITTSRPTSGGVNFIQVNATYTHQSMAGGLLGDLGNLDFNTFARKPIVN